MNFNSPENINNNQSSKSKKIIIISIFLLLIILISLYFVYILFIKNIKNETLKNEFFSSIANNELEFFLSNDIYESIEKRLQDLSYESDFEFEVSTTMENNMISDLDLSKFKFSYDIKNDSLDNRKYFNLDAKYAENDLINFDFVSTNTEFSIKSDEIVNKYVGVNKKNLKTITNKLAETEVDFSNVKKLKDYILERENVNFKNIQQKSLLLGYVDILKENSSAESFSKKDNIVLEIDSEKIDATEYTVNLNKDQFSNILNQFSKKVENDGELISELVVNEFTSFDEDEDEDNENKEIVEYQDNDQIVNENSSNEIKVMDNDNSAENNEIEVPGEENNFNTSTIIWGENTLENVSNTLNTVDSNSTENQNVINTNSVSNQVTNETVEETEETTENTNTLNEQQVQEEPILENNVESNNQDNNPQDVEGLTENTVPNNTIIEEDNFRTQGFIEVSDNEQNADEEEEESQFIIGENYEETIKNIDKLSNKIEWYSYLLTGAKVNCSKEELIENLQKILNSKIRENDTLVIKAYVSDKKLVKIVFEIPEVEESFDIQIVSKNDNEKYLYITYLRDQENNSKGYKIIVYKKNADADVKSKIEVDSIRRNKINQKCNIELETKGTVNSKKYVTNGNLLYVNGDGEFKIKFENTLDFDSQIEIEKLNDENCLFIDKLPDENLIQIRDEIKNKIIKVFNQKNKDLNIIDISNNNSIIQQIEQSEIQEDYTEKNKIKQILIENIANKMGEYINAGSQLRLEDLEGFQIEGYEVNVSLNSDIAIITVNGYRFKLDSEFNLSDS